MAKKLLSDFTFGFEFEGFADLDCFMNDIEEYDNYENYSCWGELSCNGLYDEDYDSFYTNVNEFINGQLGCRKGRTHYDGSVKNYKNGFQSFEYSSTIYKFNARNMLKLKKFFNNMYRYGFAINETCGFHTHISFPKINEKDAIWIICQIANDENAINEFCYMKTKNESINFFSDRYANKDFLYNIRDRLNNKDYNSLVDFINSDKYRVIRIHPQGTLEWRGPRNFLNKEGGIELFIEKLYKIINILSNAMSATHLNGISKKEFFDKIYEIKQECYFDGHSFPTKSKIISRKGKVGLTDSFGSENIKYSIRTVTSKLCLNILKNPSKLMSLEDNIYFYDIIQYFKRSGDLDNVIKPLIENGNIQNMSKTFQQKLVEICPKYLNILSPESINNINRNALFRWIENANTHSEESIMYVFSNINKDVLIECSLSLLSNFVDYIRIILQLIDKGVYKGLDITSIYSRYCRCYKIIRQSIGNNRLTPNELHTMLKQAMSEGLIIDSTQNEDFGEEYQDKLPTNENFFFVVNSINEYQKMKFSPNDLVFVRENPMDRYITINELSDSEGCHSSNSVIQGTLPY